MSDAADVAELVARTHRESWGRVLASVTRACGDLDLAQDCTQRAFERALTAWCSGVPSSPVAWLTSVAKRSAIDERRHADVVRRSMPLLVTDGDEPDDGPDLLRLVLCCCHPVLEQSSQVALTLRLVCGVSTDEIARVLLVRRPTIAARITRAKAKIARARVPYRIPDGAELSQRRDAALEVIHLVATVAHERERQGDTGDLTERAWILARSMVELQPADDAEARGLLAMIVLNAARSGSRYGPHGEILLGDQDRTLWDPRGVRSGLRLATEALTASRDGPGRFALQAGIAGLHAQAASFEETDWRAIARLYERLLEQWESPVVRLNYAIARSYIDGPAIGLDLIDELDSRSELARYPYLHAARGSLLATLGKREEAATAYDRALAVAADDQQERFLRSRLSELRGDASG